MNTRSLDLFTMKHDEKITFDLLDGGQIESKGSPPHIVQSVLLIPNDEESFFVED